MLTEQWQAVDSPEPVLTFAMNGRSPRLHLNADAQAILGDWQGPGAVRVTIVRSVATPSLIAVGLDPYGCQLDQYGYASAARFTRKLGVELPLTVTLTPDESSKLLIGNLPTAETPVPLKLPPPATEPATSLRGIIRKVSREALPEETVHVDTEDFDHDDDDSDSYEEADGED